MSIIDKMKVHTLEPTRTTKEQTSSPALASIPLSTTPSAPSNPISIQTDHLHRPKTPLTPSTPPSGSLSVGSSRRTSATGSPTSIRNGVQRRKSSNSMPGPGHLLRRKSEYFEDRVEVLKFGTGLGGEEGDEVDIKMPKGVAEDVFEFDISDPNATIPKSPLLLARRPSAAPYIPTSPLVSPASLDTSSDRPAFFHATSTNSPPKLQHGHSGLCSPPTSAAETGTAQA